MRWFKSKSIINNNNNHNNNNNNNNNEIGSSPKLKPKMPKLKQWNSCDEQNLRQLKKSNSSNKISENETINKCYSEMNKKENESYIKWISLNDDNKCDSNIMAIESSFECDSCHHNKCRPKLRIDFIMGYYDKFESLNSLINNELPGYSHLQFSKDFRHLQLYHNHNNHNNNDDDDKNVDYNDTNALLKHVYKSLFKPKQNKNNVLNLVSNMMMSLKTKKDFNTKYMKLGLITKGANGKIFAIKTWKNKKELYAMKEIYFKDLNIKILYEILRNWRMVQTLELIGKDTEIYVDLNKSTFLIVLKLYKGSMCELLKDVHSKYGRCLNEKEVKMILKNGVLDTLKTMHSSGYIHGDIKPENLVYKHFKGSLISAIIDYDLCTKYDCNNLNGTYSEWRGTLGYSAPEWIPIPKIKSYISPKVDIFSLGLTILILITGQQPFLCPTVVKERLQKENPKMNIKQFVHEAVSTKGEVMITNTFNQLKPIISDDLYDLLKSMLTFDVKQRFDIHQVINHRFFSI